VVDDCVALIEAEVADKGGISGLAIKAGYKAVKGLRPGMIAMSMDHLLDDFSLKIDPFWQDCQDKKEDARAYFVRRKSDIANALLEITDDRARKSDHKVLVGAYQRLRSTGIDHVGMAMPRLAALLVKHAR
jgi:hypothetical protein